MITHCPSCHTHFRVHAEQLAARAGQVRCGKCKRVFDALEHLIEENAALRSAGSDSLHAAQGLDAAAVQPAPEAAAATADERAREVQAPVTLETADSTAASPAMDDTAGAVVESPAAAEIEFEQLEAPEPEFHTPERFGPEPAISALERAPTAAASPTSAFEFGPALKPDSAKPARRWLWLSGALLLLLALLAQVAYHYRSALILLLPEAKPYALALCASLGCDLPLPRRIELLSIEASDLQADTTNPSVMVLSATLKNRAIFSQQHPALELTLTDAQDQPIVRRVLAPQDYLGKAANAEFSANSEIALKVFIEGSQIKATGYRLYLFYP